MTTDGLLLYFGVILLNISLPLLESAALSCEVWTLVLQYQTWSIQTLGVDQSCLEGRFQLSTVICFVCLSCSVQW